MHRKYIPLLLAFLLVVVYSANGVPIYTKDAIPAHLMTVSLLRGDGPFLDRFRSSLTEKGSGRLTVTVEESRGHLVSRYPLAPALLAAPLVWPQLLATDRMKRGWERDDPTWTCGRMGKNAATVFTAVASVLLLCLLRRLGFGRTALAATLAVALGSEFWAVASQSLWQHGPAVLMLMVTLVLLEGQEPAPLRSIAGGFTTGVMVACRPTDLILAVPILLWLACHRPRSLLWFVPGLTVVMAMVVPYNLYFFGGLSGGQAALEAVHPTRHGVAGAWSGRLLEGAAGTLLSPSRGLFIYSPWVALSLVLAPWTFRSVPAGSLMRWMILALFPYLIVFSKYAVWWAGWSFGPRYWTDVMPIFGVLLAAGIDRAIERREQWLLITLGVLITYSVAVQAVGAFCYPSSDWNSYPTEIDLDHARLWDWRDNPITRSIVDRLNGVRK